MLPREELRSKTPVLRVDVPPTSVLPGLTALLLFPIEEGRTTLPTDEVLARRVDDPPTIVLPGFAALPFIPVDAGRTTFPDEEDVPLELEAVPTKRVPRRELLSLPLNELV